MLSIYALMSGQLCLYIGKTTDKIKRERGHRCKKSTKCHSKYIPEYTEWNMIILENCIDRLGRIREQYWYDTLKPLYNALRPMRKLRPVRKPTINTYWSSTEYMSKKIISDPI